MRQEAGQRRETEEDKRSEEMRRWGEARDRVFIRQTVMSVGRETAAVWQLSCPTEAPAHGIYLKLQPGTCGACGSRRGSAHSACCRGDPQGQASGGDLELSLVGEGTAPSHA